MCLAAARAHCSEESLQEVQLQFRWCSQCLAACFYNLLAHMLPQKTPAILFLDGIRIGSFEKLEEVDDMLIL